MRKQWVPIEVDVRGTQVLGDYCIDGEITFVRYSGMTERIVTTRFEEATRRSAMNALATLASGTLHRPTEA